jgi:hypothetical protein
MKRFRRGLERSLLVVFFGVSVPHVVTPDKATHRETDSQLVDTKNERVSEDHSGDFPLVQGQC